MNRRNFSLLTALLLSLTILIPTELSFVSSIETLGVTESTGLLQLSPSSGPGGVNINFVASGFSASDNVDLFYYSGTSWQYWDTQTADTLGNINFTKEIPDLKKSGSQGDNPEAYNPISFKAQGNGTVAYADYNQYSRGIKNIGGYVATGLFGNNSYLTSYVTARVGDSLTISGKYFHPGVIYVRWDNPFEVGTVTSDEWSYAQIVASSIANSNGEFETTFTIPTASIGQHYIAIEDSETKVICRITLSSSTILNISPSSGPGGVNAEISGLGFPSNSFVDIYYRDAQSSSWSFLKSIGADSSGKITTGFEVPDLGRSVSQEGSESYWSLYLSAQINGIVYSQTEYRQYMRGLTRVGSYPTSGLIGNGTDLTQNVRVEPGDAITITGKWFHPNDVIYIRWDSVNILGTVTSDQWSTATIIENTISDSSGSFSLPVTIPTANIGEHYLAIEDSQTKLIIKILLSTVTMQVTPPSGPGGVDAKFTGSGFPSNTPVTLVYLNQQSNTWDYWTSNTTDSSGKLSIDVEIPDLGNTIIGHGYGQYATLSFRLQTDTAIYGRIQYNQYYRGLSQIGSLITTDGSLYGNTSLVSDVRVRSGDPIPINGQYFNPGVVYIRWDGKAVVGTVTGNQWSQTTPIGTTIANANGTFYTTISVPTADAGEHYLAIEDSQARIVVKIQVLESTPTTTPTPIPTITPSPSNYSPEPTPSPTPSPSSTPTPSPTPTTNPNNKLALIQIACVGSTTSSGFKVTITGSIVTENGGLPNQPIQLYYSNNGGNSWQALTLVNSNSNGQFEAVWLPDVSGYYQVKASWNGNDQYDQRSTVVNFALTDSSKSLFSVNSNSTITHLLFNSETKELSFNASGQTGTEGYVSISIPKSLVADISNLRVFVDEEQVTYNSQEQADYWIITFNYSHSTHQILMDLSKASASENTNSTGQPLIYILPIIIIAVIAAFAVIIRKKQTRTNQ